MPRSFFGGLFGKDKPKAATRPVATPVRPVATPVRPATRPVAIPVRPVATPQPFLIPRGELPTGEQTTIPIPRSPSGEEWFVNGTVAHVLSSWLASAKYDQRRRELAITFLDGFTAYHEGVPEDVAREFVRAASKGGFVHDVLLGPNYVKGNPRSAAYPWH